MSPILFHITLSHFFVIYNHIIDDIINGTYDSTKGIPDTYSDAWEQALSDTWDTTVEQSTDAVPGETGTDNPAEGEDPKEPPEGGDEGDDIETPDISKGALDHVTKKHMPSKFALQLKYISRAEYESMEKLTFFNINWTEAQVIEALTLGYKEALSNGYLSGKYEFTYLGETIIIALKDGDFRTGFGLHTYTYDELYELFLSLGGK